VRPRRGRVLDLFTLELQHTPETVTAIEDTNQMLASKKGTICQEKGGVLDDPRAVIETASGTGDGVTVLVLLIMSVFFVGRPVDTASSTSSARYSPDTPRKLSLWASGHLALSKR